MPLWNFKMCQSGDTKYVYIADDYEKLKPNNKTVEAFNKIYEEFFDAFCVNDNLIEYMKDQRRVLLMEVKAYTRNDRTLLTIANIKKAELKEKYGDKNKMEYDEIIAIVEQQSGLGIIDEKKISVRKFHTHVKLLSEKNKPKQNGKQDKG